MIFILLSFTLGYVLKIGASFLEATDFLTLNNYGPFIMVMAHNLFYMGALFLCLCLIVLDIEIFDRASNDDFVNTWKSCKETFNLHRFLKYRDSASSAVPKVLRESRVIKSFNHAVYKSIVDVRQDKVTVMIKMPHTRQAQELFKTSDSSMKEYFSSQLNEYYFSGGIREKEVLIYEGKRR
jgi:hypothetical protein